jgi:hypothetical protein|tara:strand:+ start:276 stop:416 length:141 start_codon:yes stop_codon:yes gene_type:complete
MKTPDILTAALLRRAATHPPAAATTLRQLARETRSIAEIGPTIRYM